jgi:uncharacterized membrane protein
MDRPDNAHETRSATPPDEGAGFRGVISSIQSRIVGGLVLALPIVLTFWIIYWLYETLKQAVLDPMARLVRYLFGREGIHAPLDFWWDQVVSPAIAIVLVLTFLYFLGLFVRSRLHTAVDWVLLRLPVVTTIYKALSNVFRSLGQQFQQGQRFKRVVLVQFPHPGARSLAFVTNSLQDVSTGKTILCVCVLTGVMPPAGFTLFVPEESVTDIDWSVNETLQAIVSGGITAPASIHYFEGHRAAAATGPIVDPLGHPIERLEEPRVAGQA